MSQDSFPFPSEQPNRRSAGRLQCMGATCQFGPLLDLSKAGAKVLSKKAINLPEGASVNLKLQSMDACMMVPARPVSSRKRPDGKYDVGFVFLNVSENMGRALVQVMRAASVNHEYTQRKSA